MDTALFVMSAGETKEDSTLVCFTESKDKDVCLHVKRFKCASPYKFIIFFYSRGLMIKIQFVPNILTLIFLCLYRSMFGKEN